MEKLLDLVLAYALILQSNTYESFVIDGQFEALNSSSVTLDIISNILLYTLDVLPQEYVSILVSSRHDVASVS